MPADSSEGDTLTARGRLLGSRADSFGTFGYWENVYLVMQHPW
ncbi:MAG TPA: hypothetical protein VFN75_07000 [Pseudonocardiaceae bacterium]|nr:hypothetical protein [Pseudonocardiaceae bacterium]